MTDPFSDTRPLQEMVQGFAETYTEYPFAKAKYNTAATNILIALPKGDWNDAYRQLKKFAFGCDGQIRANATALLRLIEDAGVLEPTIR